MPDQEIKIIEDQSNQIKAKMRSYTITIGLKDKTITHDCADWNRTIEEKKLCKHVDKLLLALTQDRARLVITDLQSNKSRWQFQSSAFPITGTATSEDTSHDEI